MKIYKDGEYVKKERCALCGTKVGVFYDKSSDLFLCSRCLHEGK